MKALVFYDSIGGNTMSVAKAIHETVASAWGHADLVKVCKESSVNFLEYDLIMIGSPVIDWLPTKQLMDVVMRFMKSENAAGRIRPSSPIIPGKFGVCFGTFGGPHIGEREALPMTAWLRAFLEHLGYLSLDAWHVPGAFKNRDELSRYGRLGDIRQRPSESDLSDIRNRVAGLLASLEAFRGMKRPR
ncbi:flavodoxin family protein [Desulfolutivibrio sp.]|uniref:flavodoxin family protein n=1 Tax=Desulfolutivibrio sp. TaxID=2773296 RepID=UPI002F963F78